MVKYTDLEHITKVVLHITEFASSPTKASVKYSSLPVLCESSGCFNLQLNPAQLLAYIIYGVSLKSGA